MAYIGNKLVLPDKYEPEYECDFCGHKGLWDESNDTHGELWGCEYCGDVFCTKCFIDKYGRAKYMEMMQDCDYIACPNCYEKERVIT